MAGEQAVFPVVAVPGLRPDSLGNYLASLGLLRAIARSRWPSARAAWHNGVFHIVGGPVGVEGLLDEVCRIASKREWSPYQRAWAKAQEQSSKLARQQSTKKLSGKPLALWQASADEQGLDLLAAHAVPTSPISFNALVGTGGNAGRRDFSKGWKKAVEELEKDPVAAPRKRNELKRLLLGDPVSWVVEELNAASWFSEANKLYNCGQRPHRDGAISPWAMALACEGLAFFAGGASRRLGSRARAVGAFPFVTRGAAPCAAGESGHDLAEVWTPIWERPMTLPEVVTLFSRGRAEAGGRGVLTPSAFATAVVRRGIDAGILEFRRFVLARTTSANTFEPRFDGVFRVRRMPGATTRVQCAAPDAMGRVLALVDQFTGLLADRKVGQRWRYVGLRGGVERAILQFAESPLDSAAACALLDSIVSALDRIDRNKSFRERRVAWEPLPLEWLPALFGQQAACPEARLALSVVSSFPVERPFALYRFGVEAHSRRFVHTAQLPNQWVWRSVGPMSRILVEILYRRTLDWEEAHNWGEPLRRGAPAASNHVVRWLSRSLDDELVGRWISRFALFDWLNLPASVRALTSKRSELVAPDGALCLFGLLQPLFDLRPLRRPHGGAVDLLPVESGARTPAAARRLMGLLRVRDMSAAVRFATGRYAMGGAPLVRSNIPWAVADAERLTAAILFQISDDERAALAGRWIRPQRGQEGHI